MLEHTPARVERGLVREMQGREYRFVDLPTLSVRLNMTDCTNPCSQEGQRKTQNELREKNSPLAYVNCSYALQMSIFSFYVYFVLVTSSFLAMASNLFAMASTQ